MEDRELEAIIDKGWAALHGGPHYLYRHLKSNRYYFVETLVIREADLELLVVYRRHDSPIKFARPLTEFLEKFQEVREEL